MSKGGNFACNGKICTSKNCPKPEKHKKNFGPKISPNITN